MKTTLSYNNWLRGACCAAALLAAPGAQAQSGTGTIVLSGANAPGGGIYSNFYTPVLNNSGQVAFEAQNTALHTGVYLGTTANVNYIAYYGETAPDGGAFSSFNGPALNNSGQVSFVAAVGGIPNLYLGTTSGVSSIALNGANAPGGGTFSGFDSPVLNNSGQAAFFGFTNGGPGEGIYLGTTSGVSSIALSGASAPGGGTFNGFDNPTLNNSGKAAFESLTSGGPGQGIYLGTTSGVSSIALKGASAPGGGTFLSLGDPVLNNSSQAAFESSTSGGPGQGIYLGTTSGVSSIALQGASAPGGGTFHYFGNPQLNNSGQVAFLSVDDGGPVNGVYLGTTSGVNSIALAGTSAPGGGTFSYFTSAMLNNSGQVVFAGFNVGGGPSNGIYLGDGTDLIKAVAVGDSLSSSTISSLTLNFGAEASGSSSLNDYGQVTYIASLINGHNGIFVFTPTLHFRNTSGGNWDTSSNWTLSLTPAFVHDVNVDPSTGATIYGPNEATTVNTLTINGSGPSPATLNLQTGGPITTNNGVALGANGILGGTGQISGNFIGLAGSVIQPYGSLALGNATSSQGFVMAGSLIAGSNQVTLLSSAVASLGGTTSLNGGKIVATNGAANTGIVTGTGEVAAAFTNNPNGEVRVTSGQSLLFSGSSNTNNGLIDSVSGSLEFSHALTNSVIVNFGVSSPSLITARNSTLRFDGGLTNTGGIGFSFGTNDVFGNITNNAGGRIVVSGASNVTFYNKLVNNGGTGAGIQVSSGSTAVYFGTVSGAGPWTGTGTNDFEGALSPGNSPAIVSYGGDVVFGSSNTLIIQLGGLTAGSQYDRVDVTGTLTLGGVLELDFINSFNPQAGDTFDLLNWGTLNGTFSSINLPSLSPGLGWNTSQLPIDGSIHVNQVPEPATWGLLGGGGALLLAAAKRRRQQLA